MTTDQFIQDLNKRVNSLASAKADLAGAVYESIRLMDKRIFDDGKDSTGADIGSYSRKPIYVNPNNPNNPKKFPVKGKTGQSKFLNGKPHKTGFFNGYSAYKNAIGRGSGNRVNLQLNKFFRRAFLTRNIPVTVEGDTIVIRFGMSSSKTNPMGKIIGIRKRYPKALGANKAEQQVVFDEFRDILIKHMTS